MAPALSKTVLAELLERIGVRHRRDGFLSDLRFQPIEELAIALPRPFGVSQPPVCCLGPGNGATVPELISAPEAFGKDSLELLGVLPVRCARALASLAANADPPVR